ncbi:MAG: KTSC domain-containing protein [SAR324 cluster bacterium]|nr:KTSC domain-containing protein [SAR324 cluster bacterium]
MFDVESSNLAAIGYDPETEVLRVRFKTGGEYDYADVPRETAKSFKTADSVGKFFFSEIKNEFVSMVSHELRTPLTSIQGFTDTLTESWDVLEAAEINEFLAIIREETTHLTDLVEDILVIPRLEAGQLRMDPAEFDIGRNRNLANMCRRQLQRNIKSLSPPGSVTSAVLTAEFRIDDIHQDGQTTTVGESIFTVTLVDDRGKEWRVELKIEEILAQG